MFSQRELVKRHAASGRWRLPQLRKEEEAGAERDGVRDADGAWVKQLLMAVAVGGRGDRAGDGGGRGRPPASSGISQGFSFMSQSHTASNSALQEVKR